MRRLLPIALLAALACRSAPEAPPATWLGFASRREGGFDLYEVSLQDGRERALASTPGDDYGPCWTADGRTLLFETRHGRGAEILSLSGGTRTVEVTRSPALDVAPAPAPDGRRLAFVSDRDHASRELYVMRIDGSEVTRLTFDEAYTEAPEWSPRGDWIAFASAVPAPAGGPFDYGIALMRVRPDGSGLERLTPEDGVWSSPSWSPDGRRLVCHGSRDGTFDLWLLDVESKRLRRLTDDPADDRQPAWSPDGKWIAFASTLEGNTDVWIVRPDGGGRRRLTEHPSRDECPAWRPAIGRGPRR